MRTFAAQGKCAETNYKNARTIARRKRKKKINTRAEKIEKESKRTGKRKQKGPNAKGGGRSTKKRKAFARKSKRTTGVIKEREAVNASTR